MKNRIKSLPLSAFARTKRAVFYLGISQIARIGARVIYLSILARFLGTEAFGLFGYGLSWYLAFLSITYMGLDMVIGRESAAGNQCFSQVVSATFQLQIIVAVIATCASVVVAFELANLAKLQVLLFFSAAILVRSLASWASFVLIAKGASYRVMYMESVCRIGEAGAASLVLLSGGTLLQVISVHILSWAAQAVWGLVHFCSNGILVRSSTNLNIFSFLGATPFWLGFAGIFQVWISQSPLLLFGLMEGSAHTLGQIALGFQIFGLISGVSWVALRALLPELSHSIRSGRSADKRIISILPTTIFVSFGWLAAFADVLGQCAVEFFFGEAYLPASEWMALAICASAGYALAVGFHQVLAAHGQYSKIAIATFFGAVSGSAFMCLFFNDGYAPDGTPFFALLAGVTVWMIFVISASRKIVTFSVSRLIFVPAAYAVVIYVIGHIGGKTGLPFLGLFGSTLLTALVLYRLGVYSSISPKDA